MDDNPNKLEENANRTNQRPFHESSPSSSAVNRSADVINNKAFGSLSTAQSSATSIPASEDGTTELTAADQPNHNSSQSNIISSIVPEDSEVLLSRQDPTPSLPMASENTHDHSGSSGSFRASKSSRASVSSRSDIIPVSSPTPTSLPSPSHRSSNRSSNRSLGGSSSASFRRWQQQELQGGAVSTSTIESPDVLSQDRLPSVRSMRFRGGDGEDSWEDAGHHDPSVMSSVKSSLSTISLHHGSFSQTHNNSSDPFTTSLVVDTVPEAEALTTTTAGQPLNNASSHHHQEHVSHPHENAVATSATNPATTTLTPDKLTLDFAVQRLRFLFPDQNFGELPIDFPTFDRHELITGRFLGRGGFSDVDEIVQIRAQKCGKVAVSSSLRRSTRTVMTESREFVTNRVLTQSGESRFALKQLRSEVKKDPRKAWTGMVDLVVETRILLGLVHPHIIKLRAVAGGNPLQPDFFLLLDRLNETLKARMEKWKSKMKKKPLWLRPFARKNRAEKLLLWQERLTNAFELTTALSHIHGERVIHRDLKPENIGYDLRGDIKIFDFGLSRQIHSTNHVYHLSMMTGSLRYMAPEVAKGEPYNHRCDVYSFTVLLWEMLTLKRPYDRYTSPDDLISGVFYQHERPKLPRNLPRSMKEAIQAAWDGNQFQRTNISTLGAVLRAELINGVVMGDDTTLSSLGSAMRRSTRIYTFHDQKRPVIKLPPKGLSQNIPTEKSKDWSDSENCW